MRHSLTRFGALLLAGALAAGCQDRHGPVKPTVAAVTFSFTFKA